MDLKESEERYNLQGLSEHDRIVTDGNTIGIWFGDDDEELFRTIDKRASRDDVSRSAVVKDALRLYFQIDSFLSSQSKYFPHEQAKREWVLNALEDAGAP